MPSACQRKRGSFTFASFPPPSHRHPSMAACLRWYCLWCCLCCCCCDVVADAMRFLVPQPHSQVPAAASGFFNAQLSLARESHHRLLPQPRLQCTLPATACPCQPLCMSGLQLAPAFNARASCVPEDLSALLPEVHRHRAASPCRPLLHVQTLHVFALRLSTQTCQWLSTTSCCSRDTPHLGVCSFKLLRGDIRTAATMS
jgi:hypothetical protein